MNAPLKEPPMQSVAEARRELLAGASGLAIKGQRLLRWLAVVNWLTISVVVLALLVFFDALLQREEFGLRILAVVTLFATIGYAGYRTLLPAWKFTPTPLQMARWVERSHPEAGEQLSTAVQLAAIPVDERKFGSAQFRDSAIEDWVRGGFHPEWESYLDTGRWWKSVTCFAVLMLTLIACFLIWPQESWIGLARLTAPWAARPWPRADRLELQNPPLAVAAGSQNQVEIIDARPPLPEKVDLLLRPAAEESSSVTLIPATVVGEMAVANLPPAELAFEIRAVGGEDQAMPWHRVEVVRPPLVDSFHFQVETPAYAGGESSEIVGKRIPALAGSRIQFRGHLSAPVRGLGLKLFAPVAPQVAAPQDGQPSESNASGWEIKLRDNLQDFVIADADGGPWTARQSTSWQISVQTVDDLQITLPDLWSIDVIRDAPPVVLVREPAMREVSATALLPLFGQATDDLGLVRVVARAQMGQPVRTELLAGESNTTALAENEASIELNIWEAMVDSEDPSKLSKSVPKQKAIDTTWELLRELQAVADSNSTSFEGQDVTVWIEATDTLGQLGKSQPQRFVIRTEEQLLATLADKQRQLLEQIRDLSNSQRKNRELAARTAEVIAQSRMADQGAVDALASVAQIQATISRQLSRGNASLSSAIEDMADLYEMNQLTDAPGLRELGQWKRQIGDISETSMPAALQTAHEAHQTIGNELAKSAPNSLAGINADQLVQLEESAAAQALVADQLQSLLDRASQTEAVQQVQRELQSVLSDQRQHKLDTEAFQLQEVVSENEDRSVSERAGLSVDQQSMARRLDGLVARIRALDSSGDNDDGSQLAGARKAADILVGRQASDLMRRSADRIQEQQLAEAIQLQDEIVEILEEARGQAPNSGSRAGNTLAEQAAELLKSSQAVSALAEQQAALAERISAGTGNEPAEALAQKQSQLRAETDQQARELARQAGDTSESQPLDGAIEEQDTALTELAQDDLSAAGQSAEQAAEQLARVADDLDRQSRQLDNAAKQQKIFELAHAIDKLVEQQQAVVEELEELAGLQVFSQTTNLDERMRTVARVQEEIRRTVVKLRNETAQLPAFDWALEQAIADMARCAAASERFLISPDAVEAAHAALRKLVIVQEAIQSTTDAPSPASGDAAGNDAQADQSPNDRLVPPLASLKLLRGLQADVNQQTKALDMDPARRDAGSWRRVYPYSKRL